MSGQFDIFTGQAETPEQFKLVRFQVFNWGTFSDLTDIRVSEKGFLFVGPSGAGKSTLLDANAVLMTPPRHVGFNMAAREGETRKSDRDLMTYVRGAWGQQTGKNGEAVQQYLRENTTWSALAQTYESGRRTVTIAHVYWVRGRTTERKEIKHAYLVFDRGMDLLELQGFAERDFEMKTLRALPGISVHDEFSGYSERFSRLMGIEQDGALRLLHKTQSAKNLGDLNEFMRDFMLDQPETFDIAKQLVEHFQALREAHATVVDTRRQVEVLAPAREAYDTLLEERTVLAGLAQTREHLEAFKEQKKAQLFQAGMTQCEEGIERNRALAQSLRQDEAAAQGRLTVLRGQLHGEARAQIAKCEAELALANNVLRTVENNQMLLESVSAALALETPQAEAQFAPFTATVRQFMADTEAREQTRQAERDDVRLALRDKTAQRDALQADLVALSRRRSNIPSRLLEVRERLCDALGQAEAALPFAGELMDVREDEAAWKGAAERLLAGFADNLLVPEDLFRAVSQYVNDNDMRARVKLLRVEPHTTAVPAAPRSLASKLEYSEHALAAWLESRVNERFDHVCAADVAELRTLRRGLTQEGLIRHDKNSFVKDDRFRIDDRSQWMLGGDTQAKAASLMDRLDALSAEMDTLNARQAVLAPAPAVAQTLRQCEALTALEWPALDLPRAQGQRDAVTEQLALARAEAPDMDSLEARIHEEEKTHQGLQRRAAGHEAQCDTLTRTREAYAQRLGRLSSALLALELDAETLEALQARFGAHATVLELDNLEQVAGQVKDDINSEERTVQARATTLLHAMTTQFREYMRDWPAKAAGLDATEASAPEFFALLHKLEVDGLPKYEEQFLAMLHEQGTQEMMRLQVQLDTERKAIRSRLEAVNDSLRTTAFNPGTYLVIETKDKMLPEVMAFRQNLREAYGNYLQDTSADEVERRFGILNAIVSKLESKEPAAKAWRDQCLDVREHVEFIVRELEASGNEVEVYRSGAGKSGGQRQKLTATCLAAALRYQLGGKDTGKPKFSTVFMDEAFDKADAEFTDLAMKVFETFGFQLVVATPLKSVMTLEPYIGGAAYVYIEARKRSCIVPVTYLSGEKRLDFSAAGVDLEAVDDV